MTEAIKITSLPFVIDKPGNYAFAGDLSYAGTDSAITITASNVVLDLGGYSIKGPHKPEIYNAAIYLSASDVEIKGGGISGFMYGIRAEVSNGANKLEKINIHHLQLAENYFRGVSIKACDLCTVSYNKISKTGGTSFYQDPYAIAIEVSSGNSNQINYNEITEVFGAGIGEGVGISLSSNCSECEVSRNYIANSRVDEYSGTFGIWTSSGAIKIHDNKIETMLYGICRKNNTHSIEVTNNQLYKINCIVNYDNMRSTNQIVDEQKCFDTTPNYYESAAKAGDVRAMYKNAVSKIGPALQGEKYQWLAEAAKHGHAESLRILKRDSETYKIKEAAIWLDKSGLGTSSSTTYSTYAASGFFVIALLILISGIISNRRQR